MEAPVNIIMFYSFSLSTTQSHQFVTNITNNSIHREHWTDTQQLQINCDGPESKSLLQCRTTILLNKTEHDVATP